MAFILSMMKSHWGILSRRVILSGLCFRYHFGSVENRLKEGRSGDKDGLGTMATVQTRDYWTRVVSMAMGEK